MEKFEMQLTPRRKKSVLQIAIVAPAKAIIITIEGSTHHQTGGSTQGTPGAKVRGGNATPHLWKGYSLPTYS